MADGDMERVRVELGPRSYEIVVATAASSSAFAAWLRPTLEATWAGRGCRRALLVTDDHLSRIAEEAEAGLAAAEIASERFTIPAGESSKSLEQAARAYERLAALKADRHTLVVAVGGGVVGDLAGFIAATYTRGLPLLMLPTTLLAQVDSSVGGKVGVNLPAAKNIVGSFHQPIGVWIDTRSLESLPDRDYRCGLAEVVKYGVILDADFFDELERTSDALGRRDPACVRRVVAHSCRLKAEVVTQDEREETGLRAVLNFGHTIGHAVEAVAGYRGDIPHGEAVAIGMVAESRLAERLGWIDPSATDRLVALLERLGLPTTLESDDLDSLVDAMGRDKKNRGGRIRFVLPRRIGHVELTDLPTVDDIRSVLVATRNAAGEVPRGD
ncbi:MAG: 3-dehydroquinate synthase [Isosphaeraceae bacterium]|nr:3-dehydroquinate synthase [Isosphaeraceae bacterium]